jgi:Tol biopolymer transport system component
MPIPNSATTGLSWLTRDSLVINLPLEVGDMLQLFRVSYPGGQVSRLTNDPNNYVGVSVSGNGGLVTARRDQRMDIWVGGADGSVGSDVVRRAPINVVGRLAWAGDRLVYGTISNGRQSIMRIAPGQSGSEELMLDALTPAVTSDSQTIAFVTPTLELWTADARGRKVAKLASSVSLMQTVITPDDRSVLYVSIVSGTVAIWTVPIAGGTPAKLTDGASGALSPDGASLAIIDNLGALGVCSLPRCADRRTIGSVPLDSPLAWTPDGRSVAYPRDANLWAQPIDGGPARQLTRFADTRPIGYFAWSRDGKRLAISRSTVTNDIVLLKGLK